ncbi:hypothetical protein CKA32_004815 [Geitlerinema sp. FC II]|nr:hypothetical protein CKA32_004815 [Geitlerinema sp. FC II]
MPEFSMKFYSYRGKALTLLRIFRSPIEPRDRQLSCQA